MSSNSAFYVRRAERSDIAAIQQLIRASNTEKADWTPVLEKRYGKLTVQDMGRLIDTCPFTAVATSDVSQVVYGFLAVSDDPFDTADRIPSNKSQDWLQWAHEQFECPQTIQLHNTMFLRFFVVDPLVSLPFTYEVMTALFNSVPRLQYLGYMQPLGVKPFAPFCGPRYAAPGEKFTDSQRMAAESQRLATPPSGRRGSLNLLDTGFFKSVPSHGEYKAHEFKYLARQLIVPKLRIRQARVEDCDDLVPMFKRHEMMDQHATDYHLAQLIESSESHVKTLVAEVSGKAVGFMSLSSRVDYDVLVDCYHLEPYETLLHESVRRSDKKKRPPKFFNAVSLSRSLDSLAGPSAHRNASRGQLNKGSTLNLSRASLTDINAATKDAVSLSRSEVKLTAAVSQNSLRKTAMDQATQIQEADPTPKPLTQTSGSKLALDEVADSAKAQDVLREDKKVVNAFCVTLFCIEDRYESMATEFLKTAFEQFPDKEYCLMTLPTDAPESPLMAAFTKVSYKLDWCPPHCLYIVNRYSIDVPISVRQASVKDANDIYEIIQDLNNESELVSTLKQCRVEDKDHPSTKKRPICLVAEAYGQIVGIVIVDYADPKSFLEQFDVENFMDVSKHDLTKPTLLRNFILNPIFTASARYIVGEVFRLLESTALFYPMEAVTRNDLATRQLVANVCVPVRRRRQVVYPDNLKDGSPVHPTMYHALRMISIGLLHEPRLIRNAKIVIVGASDTGMAFAEELIYTSHLEFTNITLVSVDGLSAMEEGDYFPSSLCYSRDEIKQIGLENYVHVIPGTVCSIRRELKQIMLSNDSVIPYDYLILAPGLQFHSSTVHACFTEFTNVFGVNPSNALDVTDAMSAVVQSQYWPDAGETVVIVYGDDMQSYTTLYGLLTRKIEPTKIALVLPATTSRGTGLCFENKIALDKVHRALQHLGVRILHGDISEWSAKDDRIQSVKIKDTAGKAQTVSCQLLLYSHIKTVNQEIFKAINDACLVFDGRLVIDAHFRTHDPSIFAAGSVTKYSVRYKTGWSHEHYDSREVGKKYFDPMAEPLDSADSLYAFKEAKKVEAILPGDYLFLHIDRPHLNKDYLDERLGMNEKVPGDVLTTQTEPAADDPAKVETHFRIHLDSHGYIQSLSYIGKKPLFTSNLCCLFGLHEKYLNGMLTRYHEGIIADFTLYFNDTWAIPVYYDRFPLFLEQSRRELLELATRDERFAETKALLVRLQDMLAGNAHRQLTAEERTALYGAFDRSEDRKFLDAGIRRFLRDVLPME